MFIKHIEAKLVLLFVAQRLTHGGAADVTKQNVLVHLMDCPASCAQRAACHL